MLFSVHFVHDRSQETNFHSNSFILHYTPEPVQTLHGSYNSYKRLVAILFPICLQKLASRIYEISRYTRVTFSYTTDQPFCSCFCNVSVLVIEHTIFEAEIKIMNSGLSKFSIFLQISRKTQNLEAIY